MKHAVSASSTQVVLKPRLWSLFITSKCGRDISITTPDVQINHVVSALTVLSLPRPTVYLRRGALAAGGESWLIVSSCNITGPSLRGQRLCTCIHNPHWNAIAAAFADRYWITRLFMWSNFYAVFTKTKPLDMISTHNRVIFLWRVSRGQVRGPICNIRGMCEPFVCGVEKGLQHSNCVETECNHSVVLMEVSTGGSKNKLNYYLIFFQNPEIMLAQS